MEQDIDDYLFDFQDKLGIKIDLDIFDKLIELILQTAKNRSIEIK